MDAEIQTKLAEIKRRRISLMQQQISASPIKTPDGRTAAPGTTAEEAARVPAGMIYDERTGGYVDTALQAERLGKGRGAAASYMAGTPLVGESMDEIAGAVSSALTGKSPEIEQETFRQSRQQFQESNPKTATALEIGGGVVGSLPAAAVGASGVAGMRGGMLAKGATAAAGGAATGAVEGAAQGYGAGRGQERTKGARSGAMMGGALGAALGPTAAALGYGAGELVKRVKGMDVRVIADEFGLSPKAARVVQKALRDDDLEAASRAISSAGDGAMLADAGEGTAALLDAAMASGGKALRVGRQAVDERASAVGARLGGDLDNVLGVTQGRKEAQRRISQRTAPARKKAYDAAYSTPIDYAGSGQAIEDVLSRVPSGTLRKAVQEANDAMQTAGVKNQQIMARELEDGVFELVEMPNVQQIDEIRKALSQIARDETDAVTGKVSGAGLRASRLARELNTALGDAVPAYKRATKIGGDKIAEENAFDMGARLFSQSTTVENVADAMQGASISARQSAAAGLRRQIEDRLSNVRRTITDGSTDAREAMQLVKEMSSRANKEKVELLLGPDKAKEMFALIDKSLPALELRAAVAGNSKTAIRQAIQGQVAEEAAPGFLRKVASEFGNPLDAAKEVTQTMMRANGRSLSDAERAIYGEIADALTAKRGRDAQQALRTVRKALEGQPINDAQARQVGKVAGALIFSGGYRPTQEALAY